MAAAWHKYLHLRRGARLLRITNGKSALLQLVLIIRIHRQLAQIPTDRVTVVRRQAEPMRLDVVVDEPKRLHALHGAPREETSVNLAAVHVEEVRYNVTHVRTVAVEPRGNWRRLISKVKDADVGVVEVPPLREAQAVMRELLLVRAEVRVQMSLKVCFALDELVAGATVLYFTDPVGSLSVASSP